jgi:hypothetical protein
MSWGIHPRHTLLDGITLGQSEVPDESLEAVRILVDRCTKVKQALNNDGRSPSEKLSDELPWRNGPLLLREEKDPELLGLLNGT